MPLKVITALFLSLVIVVFALQNPGTVNIRFLRWQTGEISLLIIIFGSTLIGSIIMALVNTASLWGIRKELKQTKTELEALQASRNDNPEPKS